MSLKICIPAMAAFFLVACGGDNNSVTDSKNDAISSSSSRKSSGQVICKTDSTDTCEYGVLVDDRDGKIYKTVNIDGQWWMAENLNYADSIMTPSLLERTGCYNNEPSNCSEYGRLYTWAAAIDSVKLATDVDNPQDCGCGKTCSLPDTVYGICPSGWHLPTRVEWLTLFKAVGGYVIAEKILKSRTGWKDDGNGTDGVGFSVKPLGGEGEMAHFWSASVFDYRNYYSADCFHLFYSMKFAEVVDCGKSGSFSVRCLKDSP